MRWVLKLYQPIQSLHNIHQSKSRQLHKQMLNYICINYGHVWEGLIPLCVCWPDIGSNRGLTGSTRFKNISNSMSLYSFTIPDIYSSIQLPANHLLILYVVYNDKILSVLIWCRTKISDVRITQPTVSQVPSWTVHNDHTKINVKLIQDFDVKL